MKKSDSKALIYACIAVLLWSTVASVFKLSLEDITPPTLLLLAVLTSTLFFWIVILVKKELRDELKSGKSKIWKSALYGFINPFLYYLVLFTAYDLLPAQEAQPLNYTWPIILSILSVIVLKQKLKLKQIIAICISFIGVVIIVSKGNPFELSLSNKTGLFLALMSAFIWASYWILNLKDTQNDIIKMAWNFTFGLFFIVPYFLIKTDSFHVTIPAIKGAIYIGLFEMGLTFLIWMKALRLSSNTARVSNIIYLAPFISLIFIRFLTGENILRSSIIGLVLIICGIVIQDYTKYTSK